jgi:hypothetical protein
LNPEQIRLSEDARREKNWKRWGPYLSERQWGTVREDYSAWGTTWTAFTHDHARSRAYRWGEDGLLGITDREGRLCFAIALWNGQDPILKERLFGLTGEEGNHGEDVKECYFYLDSAPTHSWMKALYKYPQRAFPYQWLVDENRRRTKKDPEFELLDTGIFAEGRYFDVTVEYAKASPNDILVRVRIDNRGPEPWPIHVLPTVWFRNTWSWGRSGEGYWPKPSIRVCCGSKLLCEHVALGRFSFEALTPPSRFLFTENETNYERLYNVPNPGPYVKDAFDRFVVHSDLGAVNPVQTGTKAAAYYDEKIPSGQSIELRFRLCAEEEAGPVDFDAVFRERIRETDLFFERAEGSPPVELDIARSACASLLWSKQFYHFAVLDWLQGDPAHPTPPPQRLTGRNYGWEHLYNRDVLSMPDNWEFPWYASWDLAFHTVALVDLDPHYAKEQLLLLLREWYMHPSGQIPAYEFAFGDVNPPVHAWAAWRVYKISAPFGQRDRAFLERVFQKLLINFTWWVNRKDVEGKQVFSGGFLGLDNIGVFDRSQPITGGGVLEQADGSAWMAFYCATMLSIAMELAHDDPIYEDVASKFFEHFVAIADAMNTLGGNGLWDEDDGFYYDQMRLGDKVVPLKLRSMVGLVPLFAVGILEQETIDRLPGFRKRMEWFLNNRRDLYHQISIMETRRDGEHCHRLLAIPTRGRLLRVLTRLLDEKEFLSPFGIRSLSAIYSERPYELHIDGEVRRVSYDPGESTTGIFGGNSNWRGPIWLPMNYLILESLERYHHFYGEDFRVECPTGSGNLMTLREIAREINRRICSIFLPDSTGWAPWQGEERIFADDPNWRGLTWFNEYFHADTGRGCGANHQTGWTALVSRCLRDLCQARLTGSLPASTEPRPRPA